MWAGRPASASWAGNWAHPTGPSTGLGPGAWSASPPRTPSSPSRPRARGRAGSRVSSWPLGGDRPGLGRGRGAGRPATGSGSATVCGVRLGRRPGVRAEGRVGRGMTPFAGTARARQSPGWVRAPVPRPEPAPGHTEAWAPRHARDAAKAGDPGAGPPDSPPGWKRRLWEGVTATPTDAPGRPLTGLAGAHAHSRTGGRPRGVPHDPHHLPSGHIIRPGLCVLERREPPWTPKSAPHPHALQEAFSAGLLGPWLSVGGHSQAGRGLSP